MPKSPNPSPRRSSSDAKAPAKPTRVASRPASRGAKTVDLSYAAKPGDPGSKRRALRKKQVRRGNLLAWTVAGAITVVLAGTGIGIWSELQEVRGRVAQKRAILSDLSAQLESGKTRLRALSSSSGKERVLTENGFIKPGERLLLFPKDVKK